MVALDAMVRLTLISQYLFKSPLTLLPMYLYNLQVQWRSAGQWLHWMGWCPSLLSHILL